MNTATVMSDGTVFRVVYHIGTTGFGWRTFDTAAEAIAFADETAEDGQVTIKKGVLSND